MGATPQGTRRYLSRHRSIPGVELGRTGLVVSPVGFGSYRVNDSNPEHSEALKIALRSGCNLIDTSANYTDGGSERAIGEVLRELMAAREIERDEVVIVTKAGYVQGQNMVRAQERLAMGRPFAEIVEYSEGVWHCISPDYLEDQITRSLQRLGLERIDALLLHNPEYFLKSGGAHAEYYDRIRRSFEHLENEVERGRIACYGVSSNAFPEPRESPDFTSLELLVELARGIRLDHHFALIEFPLNLFEAGAALEENNAGAAVAKFASRAGLGTLVNRPLNAFNGSRMVRLADFPSHVGENVSDRFRAALGHAMELETKFKGGAIVSVQRLAWGHIIRDNFVKLADILRWREIRDLEARVVRDDALEELADHGEYRAWADEYRRSSDRMFDALTALLESEAAIQSKVIAAELDQLAPELRSTTRLASKAVRVYRSIPGVDCVLVGMRKPEYVRHILEIEPPIPEDRARAALIEISQGGSHEQQGHT